MRFIPISSSIELAMIARRSMLLGLGAVLLPVPGRTEMPVRIACHDGRDPFWLPPSGLALRVLEEIAVRRAGCRLIYVRLPTERAIQSVLSNENDALFTNFRHSLRDRFVVTPAPLLRLKAVIVYRHDNPARSQVESATALEQLRPLRMVILRNNETMANRAATYGPFVTMSQSQESGLQGVAAGRGDFIYMTQYSAEQVIVAQGLGEVLAVRPVDWSITEWRFGLRTNFPDAEAVIGRIDAAADAAWSDGTLDRLVDS
jgi:ABC-type amino acid transport substrate-binding protein